MLAPAPGGVGDTELFWETCRCLEAALGALDRGAAELLRHVELEGMPLREAARVLGMRANTAAVRLHRARRAAIRVWRDICRFCRLHWRLDCDCARRRGVDRGARGSAHV